MIEDDTEYIDDEKDNISLSWRMMKLDALPVLVLEKEQVEDAKRKEKLIEKAKVPARTYTTRTIERNY